MQHLITSITITNYKSIIQESIELAAYTPLIGYNNAGKSNIINAIKWLLRKSSLPSSHFHDPNIPVEVSGTISGITEDILSQLDQKHKKIIEKYISDKQLVIKRIQNIPNDSTSNIKLLVQNPKPTDVDDEWILNPTGIDNAINALFPEPIHIGAMENAEEDVAKSKSSTTIGKLLAEIIEPIELKYGNTLQETLNGLKKLLDADGEERASELSDFDTAVNKKIDTFFPDVSIKLHVPTPELKEVFTKGTIKVYEREKSGGRDVASLGHGAQRSIQMALIRHLAEIKRGDIVSTNTLLLIDEPELYLHPHAIEIVRDALKQLSHEGYQILFTTHSPIMITHEDVGHTVLIRKNNTKGTYRRKTLKSAIPDVEKDATSQLHLMFSLSNSTNILFSERIILTEGKTEQRILPIIFEKITGKTIGFFKFALIKQGGVTNTRKSMLVLKTMDLPCKSIVDLDYVFKHAVRDNFLEQSDAALKECHYIMSLIAASNNFKLDAEGWPISDKSSPITPAKAFSLLASDEKAIPHIEELHNKLKQLNIWVWKKGSIEDHLGLTEKHEKAWAIYCDKLKKEKIENVIQDHEELNACIGWLCTN